MRVNNKYSSVCWNRIGMYRKDACYDCVHLEECDKYYNEQTGEFDYPVIPFPEEMRRRNAGASVQLRWKNDPTKEGKGSDTDPCEVL